jgi:periplasmic protein TonB
MNAKLSTVLLPVLVPLFAQVAWAQTAAPAPAPTTAPAPSGTPVSERTKRDADKVFQMILMHADKKPAAKAAARDSGSGGSPAPTPAPPPATVVRTSPVAAPSRPVAAAPSPEIARPASPAAVATPAPSNFATASVPASTVAQPAPGLPSSPGPALPAAPAELPSAIAQPSPNGPPAAAPAASNKLELVSSVEPDYPSRLLRTLGSGKVVVQFAVNAGGVVTEAEAVESSHKGLEAAAVAAVKQWRFKPMAGSASGMTELKFE